MIKRDSDLHQGQKRKSTASDLLNESGTQKKFCASIAQSSNQNNRSILISDDTDNRLNNSPGIHSNTTNNLHGMILSSSSVQNGADGSLNKVGKENLNDSFFDDDILFASKIVEQSTEEDKEIPVSYIRITHNENECLPVSTEDIFAALQLTPSLEVYKKYRKINQLYEWQKACLTNEKLLGGSNFILSLNPGAGKTLIAELLILRELLVNKKDALLMLPFKAIVDEKMSSLNVFKSVFGINIEEYSQGIGQLPPNKTADRNTIFVASYEKASFLIDSLIIEGRLDEIGLVVLDEMHMLNDESRGAQVEVTVFKCIQLAKKIQLIGLSGTLGNVEVLCKFMRAVHFNSGFRPVKLHQSVKHKKQIFNVLPDGKLQYSKDIKVLGIPHEKDPENLASLIYKVIPGKSVIIFCPTKAYCCACIKGLSSIVPKKMREPNAKKKKLADDLEKYFSKENKDVLIQGVLAGMAFHHSDLNYKCRILIEEAYKEGTLCVLVATSTLSAGINLPARMVIIRSPLVGYAPMTKSMYLQMIGRAGRAGYDEEGEAITMVNDSQLVAFKAMLESDLPLCDSRLNSKAGYLLDFIQNLMKLEVVSSVTQLHRYVGLTLFGIQNENYVTIVNEQLKQLIDEQMVIVEQDDLKFSLLGKAIVVANITSKESNKTLILDIQEGIIFAGKFHSIFTITPYDLNEKIDRQTFLSEYYKLSCNDRKILSHLKITPEEVQKVGTTGSTKESVPIRRLFFAMILHDVFREHIHFSEIAKKYELSEETLTNIIQDSAIQAHKILRLATEVGEELYALTTTIPLIIENFGRYTQKDIIALTRLHGVGNARAKQLYKAGLTTYKCIAECSIEDLMNKKIPNLYKEQVVKIIESARKLSR
uniref:Helicase POLQ-like n=1 Tax=Rhabditophanes sp. KR3021 TaxID=114890 RepID=A0AC35TPB0_9BILA